MQKERKLKVQLKLTQISSQGQIKVQVIEEVE
jgi:hypothetical protein